MEWSPGPGIRDLSPDAPDSLSNFRQVTTLSRPQFLLCQARARLEMSAFSHPAVTAPPSPRRAVPEQEARSPIYPPPPPLPAPHPEPLLFVRLDLRIQLPQGMREPTEEQVLPDQLVRAFHRLRHRCARARSRR